MSDTTTSPPQVTRRSFGQATATTFGAALGAYRFMRYRNRVGERAGERAGDRDAKAVQIVLPEIVQHVFAAAVLRQVIP